MNDEVTVRPDTRWLSEAELRAYLQMIEDKRADDTSYGIVGEQYAVILEYGVPRTVRVVNEFEVEFAS